jgi:opacity protein-like surface antigen
MRKTLSLAAVLGLVACPVLAGGPVVVPADPVITPPVVALPPDWTGPYVGGQLGLGWASIVESGDPDIDGDGPLGGVHLGYNQDFGSFVLGVELQYNVANIEFDSGDPDDTIESLAHLKLRGGYDTGATLFYGAIGVAEAQSDGGDSGSGNLYGLGIEHRFSERLSGGVEYLVHEFDDFYSGGIDLEVQTLQARVSLHF